MTIHQILLKYWGYSVFRPLQEDIIQSVLDENDTLALLPTGGGKSICFQVPALAMEGLCVVISPLIALMKDQVENLSKRGVKAAALFMGMHPDEIDLVLNNCRFGDIRLLYISPERLQTEKIRNMIRHTKISLLAVDESHCISQWGYDFRPPYLDIANIRPLIPGVPVLALTATATPEVVKDIQQKLGFSRENVFRKSFLRKNLTYLVIHEEDKQGRMIRILNKVKGSTIIYVRNRRETKEVADFLIKNNFSAEFYHAGLAPKLRDQKQAAWTKDEKRIMVATNAFGMGIDKPNVRLVVHLDLPDCMEAYFQEAGRGGRDEKQAYAVLLYEEADILKARQNLAGSFPDLKTIRDVYQALGNFYQIPVGMGRELCFDFDLTAFSSQYGFQSTEVFHSLRFLEKEGYVLLSDGITRPSRVFIKAGKEELYRFQVEHETLDPFVKLLLRSYGGILSGFVVVSEPELARRSGLPAENVVSALRYLEKNGILDYIPGTDKPQVTFTQERVDSRYLTLSAEVYRDRKVAATERLEKMIGYTTSVTRCRSQALLAYFGEEESLRCGKCDVCIERNKISLNELEFDQIVDYIKPVLRQSRCTIEEIVASVPSIPEDKVLRAMQWLIENGKIVALPDRRYTWI